MWLFQEGRIFTTKFGDRIDSITKLDEHLKSCKYATIISPYTQSSEKSFQYLSAYNPERFELVNTQIRYFTKTPDQPTFHSDESGMTTEEINEALANVKATNFGEIWERSAFMTHLIDKRNNEDVWVINVHLTIPMAPRMESTKMLNLFTQDILSQNPNAKIIIGGDFNNLSHMGAQEQMNIITEGGLLKDATVNIPLYGSSKPYNATFFNFPYDLGIVLENELRESGRLAEHEKMDPQSRREVVRELYAKECQICAEDTGILDHVLYNGFSKATATINPIPLFPEDAPVNYSKEEVRNYVLKHYNDGPAFASDHQPVVAILTY